MIDLNVDYPVLILLTGAIVVLTLLIKSGMQKLGVPSLIGYLLLGFLIRLIDTKWSLMSDSGEGILLFLAKMGLFTLLFRIGLESNLGGLLSQLKRASIVCVANILIAGLLGYVASYYLLGLEQITSIIIGTAFTATSVGISVGVWQEADAIQSKNGELLIDLAELDDISAVILMALLFTILPVIHNGSNDSMFLLVGKTTGLFLFKFFGFVFFCYLFSSFIEHPLTSFIRRLEKPPDPMLVVIGIGFIIAAFAGLLGFSLAIGAFFAGLVFSRDPRAVKMEANFLPIYDLLSPFFFIGIGLHLDPHTITKALGLGAVLFIFAILSKIIANGLPVWMMSGFSSAALIGASMVPRAEITMVIMQHGLSLGDWAVPSQVFGAMVVVCAGTCFVSPILIRALLKQWPQKGEEG